VRVSSDAAQIGIQVFDRGGGARRRKKGRATILHYITLPYITLHYIISYYIMLCYIILYYMHVYMKGWKRLPLMTCEV